MSETTTVPQMIWVVSAEFTNRDDAVALMELAHELGVVTKMTSHLVNASNERPAREWRIGKLVLGSMVPGRSYDKEHFQALLQENGFAPSSYSPVLTLLCKQGDVERVAPATFQLRKKYIFCGTCQSPEVCGPRYWCAAGGRALPQAT